jgi:hypothetical protein
LGVVCVFLSYRVGGLISRGDAGEGVSPLWGSFAIIFPTEWVASLPGGVRGGCFAFLGVICVYLSYRVGGLTSRGCKGRVFRLFLGRLHLSFLCIVDGLTSRGDAGEGVSTLWGSFAFIFPIEWVASRGVLLYKLLSFRQGRKPL